MGHYQGYSHILLVHLDHWVVGCEMLLTCLCCMLALHFVYYNFAKIHKTLRVTPAMEAGLMDRWMEISDIVKLTDKY